MEKRERLKEVVEFYAGGNQSDFCKAVGITTPAMSRLLSGQMKLTQKYILKIRAVYPTAADYLDGIASLPKAKSEMEIIAELKEEVLGLKRDIELKNRIIDAMLTKMGV